MFFRSIRFRLTLWYALTLAVILAASGFFWHLYLESNLLAQVDQRLLKIAGDVASYQAKSQELGRGNPCERLLSFRGSHHWGEYLQLLDVEGNVLCYSANLDGVPLPFSAHSAKAALREGLFFQTVEQKDTPQIRLLTYPLRGGDAAELLRVGENLDSNEAVLRGLRLIFLTSTPLAILALAFGGWFLAGRALAPVVRITSTVRKISAEKLSQRLPVRDTRDEIAELELTFNEMLHRLEESFNKIKQFTGDASHELRTPLAILRGETEVTLRWAKDPEELRRTLESNMEEIDRMERIIEDLLTLAKSEAGESRLEITSFSLSDQLQDLYLQGRMLAEPKDIEFSLTLRVDKEILIDADQLQLHRVFLNLISNAIKYTPRGGKVDVSLTVQGDQAVVAVADTGIGIGQQHLPHIFDRFYRVDEARNREVGGTGLGLAIVKWIVAAHGGRIEVRSTPGEGSVFTVYIPKHGPPYESEPLDGPEHG
ncbi:two-component sensor histidine kinase [Desulfuromonas versatilis]|uniref:histidine kinase n=1 Tax=Desulfuromonas versatilis TaxID=2802975 RepID=A0ABN6DU49_9BACT|nr:heavy metal sensor histidine kinase [Desulfuromonas versatilis]BCR03516.1 two-component sensor histidine kinase [Desulfuromonas versatilis]